MALALLVGAMGACGIRQGEHPQAPAVVAPTSERAAPGSGDPQACAAARRRVTETVEAAATGCKADEDCDRFQTCYPVTRASTAGLWKLHDEANRVCQGGPRDVLTCAGRAVRCQEGRCRER